MPLKPGQQIDLKVKLEKLKGLKQLEEKVQDLLSVSTGLTYGKLTVSAKLKKDFEALHAKVQSEIIETNNAIVKLKATQSKASPALDKLVKTIAKECSQVLPYYRKAKLVLVRGTEGPTAFVGRSWEKREPKDSSEELQKYYDMILKKAGFKALRSNSIFTTSDMGQADKYGDVYVIFPKNGFAFHWNKHESDLVLDDRYLIFNYDLIDDIVRDVYNWYEKKTGKELNWNYSDPYEVTDAPEKFIDALKKLKYPKANKITLEKLFDLNNIKNEIGPTKDNFLAGLKSGNEMMISGEYYAISFESDVANYVLKALKIEATNKY